MTTTMAILAMTTVSRYLSAMWKEVAPALGNHLWQSTLFAIAAGLLTLLLRKNQARARYGLWLAASLKFLIPFALLVNIGTHLAWSHRPAGTNAGLYLAMQEVSQPFIAPISIMPISPAAPTTLSDSLVHLLPSFFPSRGLPVSPLSSRYGACAGAVFLWQYGMQCQCGKDAR